MAETVTHLSAREILPLIVDELLQVSGLALHGENGLRRLLRGEVSEGVRDLIESGRLFLEQTQTDLDYIQEGREGNRVYSPFLPVREFIRQNDPDLDAELERLEQEMKRASIYRTMVLFQIHDEAMIPVVEEMAQLTQEVFPFFTEFAQRDRSSFQGKEGQLVDTYQKYQKIATPYHVALAHCQVLTLPLSKSSLLDNTP